MKTKLILMLGLIATVAGHTFAGSATWSATPVDNVWNNPANWTPPTVPNGPADIATFGTSNITAISIVTEVELDSLVLNSGASAYTFSVFGGAVLTMSGEGIVNTSGITQNFVNAGNPQTFYGSIIFSNAATAGSETLFTNNGGPAGGPIGEVTLKDDASAGNATFIGNGGSMFFKANSTAANATIIVNGSSSASVGASIVSLGSLAAANATFIATDGTLAGGDIGLGFIGDPGPNTARFKLYGKGSLGAYSGYAGSLEGDGLVIIQPFGNLHIGGNNLSTTFSGRIKGNTPFFGRMGKEDLDDTSAVEFASGAVTKIGTGTLTLSGPSHYSAGTTITDGALIVANTKGSGTGKAPVVVQGGTLGGGGTILGGVGVANAILSPSNGLQPPSTLSIKETLRFDDGSTYLCYLQTIKAVADQVVANGVTINPGALFALRPRGNETLTLGQVFTVISNVATTPINGTFGNLPDGQILVVNGSNLQASYTGGDGNDLTLTVVP